VFFRCVFSASLLEGKDLGQMLMSATSAPAPAAGGAAPAAGGKADEKKEEPKKKEEKPKEESGGDMGFSLFD
jgi:large subunit ribosomal protein LP1